MVNRMRLAKFSGSLVPAPSVFNYVIFPSMSAALSPTTENGRPWPRSQLLLPPTRKNSAVSLSMKSPLQPIDILNLDPDELFTQHIIADVKLKRQRLRYALSATAQCGDCSFYNLV